MKNTVQRASDESDNNTSAGTPTAGGDGVAGVRTTGRVKKPKAVFDPSDNYLPRAVRMSIDTRKPSVVHKYVPLTAKAAGDNVKQLHPTKKVEKVVIKKEPVTPSQEDDDAEDLPPGELCYLCKKGEPKRGSNNIFVSCSACQRKCHRACVTHNYKDFKVLREKFKCDYCRDCSECKEVPGAQLAKLKLITCTVCGLYFHRTCHTPNVRHNNLAKWKCSSCNTTLDTSDSSVSMQANEIREIIGEVERKPKPSAAATATVSTVAAAKRQITNGEAAAIEPSGSKKPRLDSETKTEKRTTVKRPVYDFKVEVPHVKGWSVEQVCGLVEQFFPDEAKAFREHDIDGDALLVLKRSDVLTHMPFKLGPALRIYNLILKLQTRINDATLSWDI